MNRVDATGLSCPEPVIKAKKALKESSDGIEITVDNIASKENVSRFLEASGCKVSIKDENGSWTIKGVR